MTAILLKPAARRRQAARIAVLCLAMSVSFDPHLLVLSWSGDRHETLAATSRATCTQAMMAISEGRWLADDPPTGMQVRAGKWLFGPRALSFDVGYPRPPLAEVELAKLTRGNHG